MRQISIDDIPKLWIPTYREVGLYLFSKQCRANTYVKGAHRYYGKYCAKNGCMEDYCLTVDHVVPITVAYYLNWTVAQTVRLENLQLLCQPHHKEKDLSVKELRSAAATYNLNHQNQLSVPRKLDEEVIELLPRI